MKTELTIGLFGSCGTSSWRDPFMEAYQKEGITYFNPQRSDWTHEYIAEENKHLHEDDIVLFPVLAETTGTGSLGEIGFSILETLMSRSEKYVIVLIEDTCTDPNASPKSLKESNNARKLVKSKVIDTIPKSHTVFLVTNLDDMLKLSLKLYTQLLAKKAIQEEFEVDV